MRRFAVLTLSLLLVTGESLARLDWAACGSYPDRWKEELHLHRQASRTKALRQAMGVSEPAPPSANRDIGHIALVEDSDGVVGRRNEFNLQNKTVRFLPTAPVAARYRFETGEGSYDAAAAEAGTPVAGLGDDDSRLLTLPFPFPFYGDSYGRVFLNSDGNLTFNTSDVSTGERSLGRLNAGPPRLAPLFRDLDPTQARVGVRVLAEAGRLVVSWVGVPEFDNASRVQTFQLRLFPDGRIEFAWQDVGTRSAVVGIAPGDLTGSSSVVSFSGGSGQQFSGSIAERFSNLQEIDIVTAAQKFYETHDDAYDYLVLFNNMGIEASSGAVAFEISVRNPNNGIGDPQTDTGRVFGSARRLQAIMNMGPLSQYPRDPAARVPSRGSTGDTPLTVLGHEAGHLFLAYVSVRDPGNPRARPMLGRQQAHWSFNFNSEASLLEGNRIRDNGAGAEQRFTTVATVEGFSALDQYLMGLRAPSEVPPTFMVEASSIGSGSRAPQVGVAFSGERRNITIDEIIQAEGRRTPDHTVAQRRFRFAFLLVAPRGVEPSADELAQLEAYRQAYEAFFRRVTSERAWADTSLQRSITVSVFPAAGLMQGATMTASATLRRPAEAPLTLLLRSQSGSIGVPSSVTVPAGATRATFEVRGVRPGADDLIVEPADHRYETVHSRIHVAADTSALQLFTVSGSNQTATSGTPLPEPIVMRVTDINRLPYPGVPVTATPSGGGSVTPTVAVTDEAGLARFSWTPGPETFNELRVALAGGPSGAITAVGRPLLAATSVVNAASFQPGITPGSLATIFGVNLAGTENATRVVVDGRTAIPFFVNQRQINFLVPADISGSTAQVVVTTSLGSSAPVAVPVQPVSPGIFFDAASRAGAILVAGTGQLHSERPAARGEILEIFCTGLGAVQPPSAAGLRETVATPRVSVAGRAAEVVFSGLAPGFAGLYQVNARIPDGTPPGAQPLSMTLNGIESNTVQVQFR